MTKNSYTPQGYSTTPHRSAQGRARQQAYNRANYQRHADERRERQREYYWQHRAERSAYNHEWNQRQREAREAEWLAHPRCCLYCGASLPLPKRIGSTFYCSQACQRRGYSAGLRPKIGNQAERICEACGRLFFSCYPDTRYCSVQCNQRDPNRADERAEWMRYYRRERPEQFRGYEQRRHERHRAKRNALCRRYRAKHRDALLAYGRRWHVEHREQVRAYRQQPHIKRAHALEARASYWRRKAERLDTQGSVTEASGARVRAATLAQAARLARKGVTP